MQHKETDVTSRGHKCAVRWTESLQFLYFKEWLGFLAAWTEVILPETYQGYDKDVSVAMQAY